MGEVVNLSGVNLYTVGFFIALSYLWGSFVFYKKSSETHLDESSVLDIIVISGFWGVLIARVGYVLLNLSIFMNHWGRVFMISEYPGLNRWFALIGFLIALLYSVKKKKGKVFDYLDLFALGYFSGISVFWIFLSLVSFEWQKVFLGLLNLVFFFMFWNLEKTYRFFNWYKGSKTFARTGFVFSVGMSAAGLMYLVELLVYNIQNFAFVLFGFVLFFVGLVLLYIRSGRILEEDITIIKKWKKIKAK